MKRTVFRIKSKPSESAESSSTAIEQTPEDSSPNNNSSFISPIGDSSEEVKSVSSLTLKTRSDDSSPEEVKPKFIVKSKSVTKPRSDSSSEVIKPKSIVKSKSVTKPRSDSSSPEEVKTRSKPVVMNLSSEVKLSSILEERPEISSMYGTRKDWCKNFSFDKVEITKVTEERKNSVIVFGKQKGVENPKEIVIKITLSDLPNNNSLSVERAIYRTVIPELLKETPHLVGYIDDFSCPDLMDTLSRMPEDKSLEFNRRINIAEIFYQLSMIKQSDKYKDEEYDKDIHILLIEKAPGMSVSDWMESSLYKFFFTSEDRWIFERDVSLQVAITLKEMGNKKLMHNDLHTGNIYVEKLPEFKLPYMVNNKEIYTEYFVRIFDYDHSSVEGRIHSTYLENTMCREFGECNKYSPKWDWFTYLEHINYHGGGSKMKTYFPDFAKFPEDEKFKKKGLRPHRGRACICTNKKCTKTKIKQEYLDSIPSLNSFIKSIVKEY